MCRSKSRGWRFGNAIFTRCHKIDHVEGENDNLVGNNHDQTEDARFAQPKPIAGDEKKLSEIQKIASVTMNNIQRYSETTSIHISFFSILIYGVFVLDAIRPKGIQHAYSYRIAWFKGVWIDWFAQSRSVPSSIRNEFLALGVPFLPITANSRAIRLLSMLFHSRFPNSGFSKKIGILGGGGNFCLRWTTAPFQLAGSLDFAIHHFAVVRGSWDNELSIVWNGWVWV